MRIADLSPGRQSTAIALLNRRAHPGLTERERFALEDRTCREVAAQTSEVADLDAPGNGGATVIMVGDRVDVGDRVGTLTATRAMNPTFCEVKIAHSYEWAEPWRLSRHYCKPRHVYAPNECACGWKLADGVWGGAP